MSNTPAGWYPDGHGAQRWWDGTQWTEHTMPAAPVAPVQPAAPAAPVQPTYDPHSEPTQVSGLPLPPATPPAVPTGPLGPPPQHPPAGYPQQPAPWGSPYPAAAPKGGVNAKLLGIVGGGAVVVIAVIVLLVLLLGGSGSGSSGPSSVVEDYLTKAASSDCSALDDIDGSAKPATVRDTCESDPTSFFESSGCDDAKVTVHNEQIDGDSATVDATVAGSAGECNLSGTASLTRNDGDWKIVDFN